MITKGFCDGLAVPVSSVGWAEPGRAYSLLGEDGWLDITLSPATSADLSWPEVVETGTGTVVICAAAEPCKQALQWIIN